MFYSLCLIVPHWIKNKHSAFNIKNGFSILIVCAMFAILICMLLFSWSKFELICVLYFCGLVYALFNICSHCFLS